MSAVEDNESSFRKTVHGLIAGDFSRLEPLFEDRNRQPCRIIEWCEAGMFAREPEALDEALSCACFVGRPNVVEYLLNHGVSPEGGSNTGVNGFHWAANRGQLEVVTLLINRKVPLESRNMYGSTVLGIAVWSALNEPRPNHVPIIEALIKAGANVDDVGYPSGKEPVDEVFRRLMTTP